MRILLTAAGRHGATAEILDLIARVLRERGFHAEVRNPGTVDDLRGYDAVVLGSAVYYGSWLPAARDFAGRHAAGLRTMPVWLFSNGPVGDPLFPSDGPSGVPGLLRLTGARGHRLFGGRLDRRSLGPVERAVARLIPAADGDYRDTDDIEAWAAGIGESLMRLSEQGPRSRDDRVSGRAQTAI
ncbi:flavodoxin [Actinorhabdospora filicis]|uniref:Flavodoxin n=1 Tax=Actinorhabdospora filicis TaxID=1785913 RepID=A0A9W6SLB1_9ACTN|nr:flavodoxin domain-containing protein [Actinorhabdospora filicis]GLZ78088.1 flavodoxin [Actinorhabdospora filicis]